MSSKASVDCIVLIEDFKLVPASVRVCVGSNVQFFHLGTHPGEHQLLSQDCSLVSPEIKPCEEFVFNFSTPGVHKIHCSLYNWICGTVIVCPRLTKSEDSQRAQWMADASTKIEQCLFLKCQTTADPMISLSSDSFVESNSCAADSDTDSEKAQGDSDSNSIGAQRQARLKQLRNKDDSPRDGSGAALKISPPVSPPFSKPVVKTKDFALGEKSGNIHAGVKKRIPSLAIPTSEHHLHQFEEAKVPIISEARLARYIYAHYALTIRIISIYISIYAGGAEAGPAEGEYW
jgi:hypothetical protein